MQVKNQKIVVLGTGGTIAGESESSSEGLSYKAAQRGIDVLLRSVSDVGQGMPEVLANIEFIAEQVAQIDSKDMDFAIWRHLAQRCSVWLAQEDVLAVVITHGTDTLEETAYFLSRVVNVNKPIVITCAMRPANFKDADGPQNLRDAMTVAASTNGAGVWMVAAGEVHHSQFVQKVHPTRINAFDSGESGAAAWIKDDQITWATAFQPVASAPSFDVNQLPEPAHWPWVEIMLNHVQADPRHVDVLQKAGIDGLVLAGTGNGSIGNHLKEALLRAQTAGVEVRIASRCNQGPVIPTSSHAFQVSDGLNPVKTRVALLLELMSNRQGH